MSFDIPTPPALTSPYPCWGRHDRMGHTSRFGWFQRDPDCPGALLYWRPALPGDVTYSETAEVKEVLPETGPAFYGFTPMSAQDCWDYLLVRCRPIRTRERILLPVAVEVDPTQPTADYVDEDDDAPF